MYQLDTVHMYEGYGNMVVKCNMLNEMCSGQMGERDRKGEGGLW